LTDAVILDSTPLGRVAHYRADKDDLTRLSFLSKRTRVFIAEIADYEVRRSLFLHHLYKSIVELDSLKAQLIYLPITTRTMQRAAEIWAEGRRAGLPNTDPRLLDADAILMAQAEESGAVIATANERHLSRFVRVIRWQDLPIS
jgi:predicted nucleic acid-binding protein